MSIHKSVVWNFALMAACLALIFTFAGPPGGMRASDSTKFILTPKPGATPRINGPKVFGARPGHWFVYRIPCTGDRPIHFSAQGLPPSLHLDPGTGIVTGHVPERRGEYALTLRASNAKGSSTRGFKLVVGDTLALTPPMGWNDWYTYYEHIAEKVIRQSADAMISSGMADFGYAYVDIDGCWQMKPGSTDPEISGPPRDASGTISPNRRFGDMKALTDYIHAKGLKAGIYSSPGPLDCAGFEGSFGHEQADGETFARWGFDFLKYDWCSYGKVAPQKTLENYQKPYRLMGGIVSKLDRDVVLNMCQYGMGDVWNWGAEVGGNLWRTTGDLGLAKASHLPGFFQVGFSNAQHFTAAGPGHWNDPDYILIGYVGNAFHIDQPAAPTMLTPDEQYSYMSMWSLMAAPLFYSGDMTRLDPFTLNVLCNSEVIDIDQDTLGKQARIVRQTPSEFVLAKPLEDGGLAVGLFNLGETKATLKVTGEDLGLKSHLRVRDVWRQRDLANAAQEFSADVAPHGVAFVRLMRAE
jgi:alpha-galactosidase